MMYKSVNAPKAVNKIIRGCNAIGLGLVLASQAYAGIAVIVNAENIEPVPR